MDDNEILMEDGSVWRLTSTASRRSAQSGPAHSQRWRTVCRCGTAFEVWSRGDHPRRIGARHIVHWCDASSHPQRITRPVFNDEAGVFTNMEN